MTKNFPHRGREMDIPIHEAQRKLDRVNQKNTALRHIIKKQGQRKNFESGRRKMICPSIEIPIRQLANFLAENLQDRRVWDDIF